MKKNKIGLIVVFLLVMVAVIILVTYRNGTLDKRESDFSVQDTATVTRIFMADKQLKKVDLQKTKKGWLLNRKFPVSSEMMKMLLGTIQSLKVKAPVSLASRDNVITRMAAIGIKVEIYQDDYRINLFDKIKLFKHEKLSKVYYVGDATQNNLGTYMLMEDASQPYIVFIPGFRGFLYTRFSTNADDWKSHVVFDDRLIDIEQVKVNFIEQPKESFVVNVVDSKGNYDITRLYDGQKVENYDTLKMLNFLTSFRDLRYESRLNNILPPMKLDSIVHTPGLAEITLINRKNDTTYVKFFTKNEIPAYVHNQPGVLVSMDLDRAYALINGGEDFVLVQYYTFDKVLYPLSYYEK
jgi:hypothetical protein